MVIDNLKAGVIRADWFDPELNPKLEEFARHYGTAILPTRPAMPRHKGKVEAGVKFAQNNAVKGGTVAGAGDSRGGRGIDDAQLAAPAGCLKAGRLKPWNRDRPVVMHMTVQIHRHRMRL